MGYLELATGRHAAMVLTWESIWDHAAGLLLHAEAGGTAINLDGSSFRLVGGNALPLIVASSTATAGELREAMLD